MIITVVSIGLAVIGLSSGFQVWQRRARSARFRHLTLQANCLLTRYPIVFLAGPRTLFRLFDHWNDVPLFLREHGYEVYVIEPSGRTSEERTASHLAALQDFASPCHLIADGSLEADLELLAREKIANVISMTLVQTRLRREKHGSQALSVADLRPRFSVIETFEIESAPIELTTWSERLRLALLKAHNALVRKRANTVHPFETAEFRLSGFQLEKPFLNLAVRLAERDLTDSLPGSR